MQDSGGVALQAGMIVDDELNTFLVNPLPQGCRLHAVIDACHSGSVLDLPYRSKIKNGQPVWKQEYARQTRVWKVLSSTACVLLFPSCLSRSPLLGEKNQLYGMRRFACGGSSYYSQACSAVQLFSSNVKAVLVSALRAGGKCLAVGAVHKLHTNKPSLPVTSRLHFSDTDMTLLSGTYMAPSVIMVVCLQGTQGGEAIQFGAARDSQTAADTSALSGNVSTGAATFSFIQAIEQGGPYLTYGQLLFNMNATLLKMNGGSSGSTMSSFSTIDPFSLINAASSLIGGGGASSSGQTPIMSSNSPFDFGRQFHI